MDKRKFTYNPTLAIAAAMVAGVIAGLALGPVMSEIQFLGDIFFKLIQQCIIVFVMGQIIEAVGGLTAKELTSIGIKAIVAFLVSSLLASVFGLLAASVFQPGAGLAGTDLVMSATTDLEASTMTIQDTLSGFFSSNIISSMASGAMVPCIVFSILFGVALGIFRERNGGVCGVYGTIREINEILLTIIRLVMNIAPLGVFAYVSASVGTLGLSILAPIGKYLLVLAGATAVFTFIWLLVVAATCKMGPWKLFRKMIPMSVMAAATISSAVTLPLEMEDAKNKIGLRDEVANLVLPLGMPLNSNGSALHMAVTALFVAQMYGIEMSGGMMVYACVICWLLSLANAVAPGATLISLTMLMPALGLPLEAVAILGGLEYLVAAIRTTLNVNSDVFCALLVARSENAIDYEIFNSTK